MDIILLILIIICLVIVVIVLALPPYWPLKQQWNRYQQIKMVTLGLFLIDVWGFLKILTVISHAHPTPYDEHDGLILFILVPCLCIFFAATFILGIVLIVRRRALLDNKRDEMEGNARHDNKPLRNRLVIGILALLVAGIAYQCYQLSQPAPEWIDYNNDFGTYFYPDDSIPEPDIISPEGSME